MSVINALFLCMCCTTTENSGKVRLSFICRTIRVISSLTGRVVTRTVRLLNLENLSSFFPSWLNWSYFYTHLTTSSSSSAAAAILFLRYHHAVTELAVRKKAANVSILPLLVTYQQQSNGVTWFNIKMLRHTNWETLLNFFCSPTPTKPHSPIGHDPGRVAYHKKKSCN